jgi:hypothetical protein
MLLSLQVKLFAQNSGSATSWRLSAAESAGGNISATGTGAPCSLTLRTLQLRCTHCMDGCLVTRQEQPVCCNMKGMPLKVVPTTNPDLMCQNVVLLLVQLLRYAHLNAHV